MNLTAPQQLEDIKKELQKLEKLPYRRGDASTTSKISYLRKILRKNLSSQNISIILKKPKDPNKNKKIKSKTVCCVLCKRPLSAYEGLLSHLKAKHAPTSEGYNSQSLIEEHSLKKDSGVISPSSKTTRNINFFSVEAYNLACRSLTKEEAIKIAKSEHLSQQFLTVKSELEIVALTDNESKYHQQPEKIQGNTHNHLVSQRDTTEQNDFKKRVMSNFSNKCAITGSNLPVLQACHLEPFSLNKNHSTNNGIPLEPTLHAMLDRGLLAIHPHHLTVHFAIECYYKTLYEGKKITPHFIELDRKALHHVWENHLQVVKND